MDTRGLRSNPNDPCASCGHARWRHRKYTAANYGPCSRCLCETFRKNKAQPIPKVNKRKPRRPGA